VFTVTVSNGQASSQATSTWQVEDYPPVAVTAASLNVPVGSFAFLDGTNSYDPDGQPISFAWTLVSAPSGSAVTSASINNSQTPKPFFTPDVAGAYKLQLVVTDASASSQPAPITVTAGANGSLPPNANAGQSQNVGVPQQVTMNGSGSDPNTPALSLTYQWTFAAVPSGSSLLNTSISASNAVNAKFTPDIAGDYALNLVVSNTNGSSQPSPVNIYAFSGNIPPNANAGASQFTTPTSTVTLSSAGSGDPNNGPLPLAYTWWLNSVPASSAASVVHPATTTPQFVADTSGYFIARLEATDGLASGFANTTVISANLCDADANGVINQLDIQLIQAAIGQTALSGDPRDFDKTGTITQADVTGCQNLIPPVVSNLIISPLSGNVDVVQGSASVQRSIAVSSSGDPITFTVTSNQSWLTATPASGSTASVSSVVARLNPAGLAPGAYHAVLTFTPGTGAAQAVSFTLNVTAPVPQPSWTATPSFLRFSVTGCAATAPAQTFIVTATQTLPAWSASSAAPWLTVSPSQGTAGSASVTLTASVNASGMAPGTYASSVTISAAGVSPLVVPVNLTVGSANALTVSPASLSFTALTGTAAAAQNLSVSACAGSVPFTVQTDQPWLSVGATSGNAPAQISVTANASMEAAGSYTGHVTVVAPATTNSPLTIPVTFVVTQSVSSTVVISGVVNSASFLPGPLAGGTLFTIFGQNLANTVTTTQALPLPPQLNGTAITIGSATASLLYVSPTQINAEIPYGLPIGPAQLVLTGGGAQLASASIQITDVSPGLFTLGTSGRAAVENQDYSLNTQQQPAAVGSVLQAFFTGQGAINPPLATGAAAPLMPLSYTAANSSATIGGQPAQVLYSGMVPTLSGLAQMDIVVPALPAGDYPLILMVGGQVTNSGTVSIGP
jgi:uncharacterized protein (TIGR03437 family)